MDDYRLQCDHWEENKYEVVKVTPFIARFFSKGFYAFGGLQVLTIAGGMNEEYGALVGSFGLGYLFSKIKVNKTVINQSPPKLVQTLSVNQINSLAESYNRKLYEKINNK